MQNIPLPSTKDSNLVTALILLNREIEELKRSKVSAFDNDVGYVTKTIADETYATKSEIPDEVTTGVVTVAKDSITVTIPHTKCATGKVATLVPMSASACTFGFYLSEMAPGSMTFTFLEPLGEEATFGYVIYE